jgi:hypothetical protein
VVGDSRRKFSLPAGSDREGIARRLSLTKLLVVHLNFRLVEIARGAVERGEMCIRLSMMVLGMRISD